jgi:crossover junction endodeoxyribonuclease RuvC
MRVLGIDPGLATIGLGTVEARSPHDIRAGEWLTIRTAAGLPLAVRLKEIRTDLLAYIQDVRPELAVIEKIFFAENRKTAIDVAQARGVILLCLAEAAVPVLEVTPMQLKSCITGDGGANKRQVQDMLVRTLHLDRIPQPDDAADALALAVYGGIVAERSALSP